MHIVIVAWLYITFAMALAFHDALAGIAFFLAAGLSPVALYAWLAVRRAQARRAQRNDALRSGGVAAQRERAEHDHGADENQE
jgi:hypothetical protein